MREVAFIKQNKQKWLTFEQQIYSKAAVNPDELAKLYICLVNDLSFAQTYYPNSKTEQYLNHLASLSFQQIYTSKKEEENQIKHFFKTDVPLLMYQYRRYVLYAFLFFSVFVMIGVTSSIKDTHFFRLILGDDYVNMTLENIANGTPTDVYKQGSSWGGAIAITLNNLRVGMISYIYGVFGGIGTVYILFKNAVMLGTFQYLFYDQNVFWESVRAIWIHGSMEIFAMVIEAAAGLILGASLLFPKTYSRYQSFKTGAINSLKIVLSTIPFTIAAGILEGFVTRLSPDVPIFVSISIILLTLGCISYYYLIYPYVVHFKLKNRKQNY